MQDKKTNKKSEYFFPLFGCLAAFLMMLPYYLLGQDSIVVYHDQLDGELLTYLLNAKHLFEGLDTFPEIMKGIPVEGLTMPAPGFVFLFLAFEPFMAFMLMQFLVILTAFLSMYYLVKELTGHKVSALLTALLFMMLPFYPVYGLCIPGQPLFWLALLKLSKKESGQWKYYLLVGIYALFSSLALMGFACILAGGIWSIGLWMKSLCRRSNKEEKRSVQKAALRTTIATGILCGVYALCNINLVKQILLPESGFVSHKSEVVYKEIAFWNGFADCFLTGVDYAESGQIIIIIFSLFVLLAGLIAFLSIKNPVLKEQWKAVWKKYAVKVGIVYALLIGIALFYGVYHGGMMTAFRNRAEGVLHDFNLDRIAWLMPVLWYVIVALSLDLVISLGQKVFEKISQKSKRYAVVIVTGGIVFAVCGVMFLSLFMGHGIKPNVAKLIKGRDNYIALTWKQFWAEDLFEEVENVIGEAKEDYYVVSYGIYPAVAAYNGFYCLDGYSNNYDVNYKHAFRNVIAPELAKSEYLTEWYDEWGNRCYIVTIEKNNYFTFDKQTSAVAMTFDVDMAALKELGCDYMISAAYIMNPEEKGICLLTPEGIETQDSWYRLFVYKIE